MYGFAGAFAAGEDNLIFQQIKFPGGDAQSDLRMWDGLTGDTNAFVSNDQHRPSGSGRRPTTSTGPNLWLLYGENRFNGPKAPWRVILFDGSTAKKHVLAETTYRCGCIFPGTFAYPWVSWSKGLDGAVWRMNVETDVKEKLTVPGNRDEHSIGVTDDGTAYVVQDGAACGTHSKIFRIDPDGTATLIASTAGRHRGLHAGTVRHRDGHRRVLRSIQVLHEALRHLRDPRRRGGHPHRPGAPRFRQRRSSGRPTDAGRGRSAPLIVHRSSALWHVP